MSQLQSDLCATAELQATSPFFDKLPFEIRHEIFCELWALYKTRWHVHSVAGRPVPVFPCIKDTGVVEDVRVAQFPAARGEDARMWESRLRSPWNIHWDCAEAAAGGQRASRHRRTPLPRDFVRRQPSFATTSSPLLVCKQWYLESIKPLESVLTFCFTDTIVARDFLRAHAHTRNIRNIDISLRMKPLVTELYYPGPDGEPQPHVAVGPLTARDNPWEDLSRCLSSLPALRELQIYLDSEDLRPWYKRVNERALLREVLHARARKYTLGLPHIPHDAHLQDLAGTYIEDSELLDESRCTVVRGLRPNNWQLHLTRVSHVLPQNWTHTLWNQSRERVWPQHA